MAFIWGLPAPDKQEIPLNNFIRRAAMIDNDIQQWHQTVEHYTLMWMMTRTAAQSHAALSALNIPSSRIHFGRQSKYQNDDFDSIMISMIKATICSGPTMSRTSPRQALVSR